MINKLKKAMQCKHIELIISFVLTLIFFIIFNIFFEPIYEQVDDFIIMNLISASDGNYSIYGIFIHPIICGIIVLLFKTGINVNWYTIVLLLFQFLSFVTIGTIIVKKNRKGGIFTFILFLIIFYSRLLVNIQYTSIASLCIATGILALFYADEFKNRKYSVIGIIFIALGAMIRINSIVITIPFLIVYYMYKAVKDKSFLKYIKKSLIVLLAVVLVYFSNLLIYNLNPIYKEFLKFNDVRSYLHDFNYLIYKDNENIFKASGWSENDRDIFYTYSFGDENVYNTHNLKKLKLEAENNANIFTIENLNSSIKSLKRNAISSYYCVPFVFLILLTLYMLFVIKEKRILILLLCVLTIGVHFGFVFIGRPMFRVIISGYITGIALIIYFITINFEGTKYERILKFIIALLITIMLSANTIILVNKYENNFTSSNYSKYREVIEYTSSHKENAYLYTLILKERYLSYSVYEKIPDDTFSNLRPMGDWDTYTQNYYSFKNRYNIDNIMTDLYKKDNLYVISGDIYWDKYYPNYIDKIATYIKEHYNVDIEYEIIKEFDDKIKIYKLKQIEN